jgi:hypothetical protein
MESPLATANAALGKIATGTSVLFRRGDTFSLDAIVANTNGPVNVGAYSATGGSDTPPVMNLSTDASAVRIFGKSDWRIFGLHLVANMSTSGVQPEGSTNTLIWQTEIEGMKRVEGIAFGIGGAENLFIVDCHAHDFSQYGAYGAANHFAMIGTLIDGFDTGQHGVRVAAGDRSYIAENEVVAGPTVLTSFTIRGEGDGTTNERIVFTNNRVNRLVTFAPQNQAVDERIRYVLADGNTFVPSSAGAEYESIGITAQDVAIRNNVFINQVNGPVISVAQTVVPKEFVTRIAFYNNTYAFGLGSGIKKDQQTVFVACWELGNSAISVRNNIYYTDTSVNYSQFATCELSGGTLVDDHNLMFAPTVGNQWLPYFDGGQAISLEAAQAQGRAEGSMVADPNFKSKDPSMNGGLEPAAGSPAIDSGADAPVFSDLRYAVRPSGTTWDMGAYETP